MMTDSTAAIPGVRHFGPDVVRRMKDRVVIETAREMIDWQPSKHRPVLIELDDRQYVLERSRPLDRGRFAYELTPWVPQPHVHPGLIVTYDEELVLARERALSTARNRVPTYLLLVLLSPLVGLLWAGQKKRLEERYGIDVVAATRRSGQLVVWSSGLAASGAVLLLLFGAEKWHALGPLVLGGLLLADWFLRMDVVLRGRSSPQLGLFEWMRRSYLRERFGPQVPSD